MTQLAGGEYFGKVAGRTDIPDAALTCLQHTSGRRLPRHTHERAYYALLLSGGYRETALMASVESVPATLVFHPPSTTHSDEVAPHGGAFFIIELGDSWLSHGRDDRVRERPELAGDALGLYRAYRNRVLPDIDIEERLWSLAGEATRIELGKPAWLTRVVDRLHDELSEPHTVAALARDANVHPVHLSRTFRARFGMTAGEYLHRLRVGFIARELARGALLGDVAYAAGFADQSHMTRVCRAMTGATPRELQRLLRDAASGAP
jgi:AraC family transcriptional regulator